MKQLKLKDLQDINEGHFLKDIVPEPYICQGGFSFHQSGQRSHTNDGLDGNDIHIHEKEPEAFIIL